MPKRAFEIKNKNRYIRTMNKIDLMEKQKEFLDMLEVSGKSFNTVKNYRTDLNCYNKYLVSKGRDLHTNEMTLVEVKEYYSHLENLYNSPNSIRRRIQAMRIFYDYLLTQKLVETNPLKQAAVSPKRVDKPNPVSFKGVISLYKYLVSQKETKKPIDKLIASRNLILIELIYNAGLKVSDIAILDNKNLFEGDTYRVMVNHPKRDPYTIELSESFNTYFTDYKDLLEKQKNKDQIDFSNLLFNANPYKILSGGLSPRGIEVLFKEFSKKIEEKVTAKSLRQACVFKWISTGKSNTSIKEWLGVQPQYSLKPFHDLLKNEPDTHTYKEVNL